jgi:cell division septation protein DedD
VEPDHPLYAPAESERDLPELSDKRKGRLGPVAVTFILMTGIVGALALYAGGIDSIAGLFASQQSQSQEDLTRITARPETETESDLDGGPTPSETFAEEEEAPSSAAPDDGSQEAADGTTVETDGTERVAEEENDGAGPEADRKSNALDKESRTAPASSSRASSKPSRQTPTAQSENERTVQNTSIESARSEVAARNASTYTVQVGATTDKSEAERVAADARARGGSGVRLIETTKNGKPLYRIRFGSFSSEEEAIATARSIGFSDVWVVEN